MIDTSVQHCQVAAPVSMNQNQGINDCQSWPQMSITDQYCPPVISDHHTMRHLENHDHHQQWRGSASSYNSSGVFTFSWSIFITSYQYPGIVSWVVESNPRVVWNWITYVLRGICLQIYVIIDETSMVKSNIAVRFRFLLFICRTDDNFIEIF